MNGRVRHWLAGQPWGLWLWLLAALYSACNVVGYYQTDELGQVTAFALYKLGLQPAEHMPWEFRMEMRSWLQPGFFYVLARGLLRWREYHYLVFERFSLLVQCGLWGAALWVSAPMWRVKAERPLATWGQIMVGAMWFLPSMMVRHSSEAFATVWLVAALGYWHRVESSSLQPRWHAWMSGVLAGLAFWARFQVSVFFVGFMLVRGVIAVRRHERLLPLLHFAGGVLLTLPFGIAIDAWGYGHWAISPWNYIVQNLLQDRATLFGVEPWYYYLPLAMAYTMQPLLWLWLIAATIRLRSVPWFASLAGGVAAFVLVHSLITHKEMRFLLPVVPAAGLLLMGLLESVGEGPRGRWLVYPWYVKAVALLNIVALVVFSLTGLVRDRSRIEVALWGLPDGSTVLSDVEFYASFGTPPDQLSDGAALGAKQSPQNAVTLDLKLHEQAAVPLRFALTFAVPPRIVFRYVPRAAMLGECSADPERLVLLTNRGVGDPSVLRRSWTTLARFPPEYVAALPFSFVQRMWQFHLVRCASLLQHPL